MSWFAANGDKLLAFFTGACALAQAGNLVEGPAIKWLTFASALATLAHTIWYNNQAVAAAAVAKANS